MAGVQRVPSHGRSSAGFVGTLSCRSLFCKALPSGINTDDPLRCLESPVFTAFSPVAALPRGAQLPAVIAVPGLCQKGPSCADLSLRQSPAGHLITHLPPLASLSFEGGVKVHSLRAQRGPRSGCRQGSPPCARSLLTPRAPRAAGSQVLAGGARTQHR